MKAFLKKIFFFAALVTATATMADAQEGLAVGIGYRTFPNKLILADRMDGVCIGVDYTASELIGPLDLIIGANFDRLWHNYRTTIKAGLNDITSLLEFQLPVMIGYTFDMDRVKPFISVGPTFAAGLSLKDGERIGKWSYNLYNDNVLDNPHGVVYNRVDVLVGGNIGVILNDRLRVSAGVDYGLVNRIKRNLNRELDPPGWEYYLGLDPQHSHNLQVTVSLAFCFQ